MKGPFRFLLITPVLLAFARACPGFAATIVWTNANSGNWNVAVNWSPNTVPGSTDTAIITNNGTYTVTVNAAVTVDSLTLGGASGTQTLTNGTQTLTLNNASTVNTNGILGIGGGTTTGAGDLTINGSLIWTFGTMSGSGTTTINGSLALSGVSAKDINARRLITAGTTTWTGSGNLRFFSNGVLSNAPSGTFDINFDATFQNVSSGALFNAGLIRQLAGTNGTTVAAGVFFNNSGSLQVQTAAWTISGGGTNTGTFTVSAGASLEVASGTFNFIGNSSVSGAGTFNPSGGTTIFTNSATLSGVALVVSGGIVNFNGTGSITPPTLNFSLGTIGGTDDLTISGATIWTSGTMSGSGATFLNGSLAVNGVSSKDITTRRVVLAGATTWSGGGPIRFFAGGLLTNTASGTFDVSFDATLQNVSGGVFANKGSFRQLIGTNGTTTGLGVAFNNDGTVEVQSGALILNGGGTNTSSFAVSSGARLQFGGGTYSANAGSTIGGAGNFEVSGGTANLACTFSLTGTNTFSGGIANFVGSYSLVGGTLNISGGTVNFNGDGTITPALLTFTSGTLGGTNDVTVTGPIIWSGGTMAGTGSTFVNSLLTITGTSAKDINTRRVVTAANTAWTDGGSIRFFANGILTNAPTGTFDISFDATFQNVSSGSVANSGVLRQTGGVSGSAINSGVVFNNFGTVEVQAADLSLSGGGAGSGTFTILTGATLEISGGTYVFTGSVGGAGTFLGSAGTANFTNAATLSGVALNVSNGGLVNFNNAGSVVPATMNMSGGAIGGSNVVTVPGLFTWTGGVVGGTNSLFANGGIAISGLGTKDISGRRLVNSGVATWDSGGSMRFLNNGVLTNASSGTFNIAFDATFQNVSGNGAIANAGLFHQTAATNGSTCGVPFNNFGTVQLDAGTFTFGSSLTPYIQNSGLTLLNGGNFFNTPALQIVGGVLAGNGSASGSVSNNGVVSPGASPGRLGFGAYTQTANGALNIELSGTTPGTNFDQLVVTNTAALAGTLNATLTNGFYPATNATFTFLTAGTRSATFAAFNYPSNDVGMQINYTATNATIQVINVHPVITPVTGQTINELAPFNLQANATDDDSPAQTLTWALVSGPPGLGISPTGLITWTPDETQGPGTNNVTIKVTDNGTPNLTVTNSFQIVAREINTAPVLTLPPNQAFNEQTAFSANATATDSDIPTNSLAFELVSGPSGLTVSPAGAIQWTPGESQGSNSYTVTVRVTDNNPDAFNSQQLSTTNSFILTVNEVNRAPSVTVPNPQTITEENLLSVSASATDPDVPANGLSYSLLSPPTGMSINSGNGAITWTPDESQGSNSYTITVVVTDDNPTAINSQHLTATNSFTVTVNESNRPPALTVPTSQVLSEGTPLNVSASATDPDLPANPLTFALLSPPAGMAINPSSGAISWTPDESQGSNTYTITVTVADTNAIAINQKMFAVTNSFTVTVNESNRPPVLTLPHDATINELAFYTNNATATDPDLPANALTFALVSGPANLNVSSAGAITWTPNETQGPSTNLVSIKVTDNNPSAINSQQISVTNNFTLIVSEVNIAPVAGPLTDRTVSPGQTLVFTATATDADLPTNTLTFSLVSPVLPGASINAGSGQFSWRAPVAQAGSTNLVRVRVTDNGSPNLSDTNSFTMVVNPLGPVILTPVRYTNGQFTLSVTGQIGPDYVLQGSTSLTSWTNISTNTPAVVPFNFIDTGAGAFSNRFYRTLLQP